MDLNPLITQVEPALVSLAGAAITALAAYGAAYIRARWHLSLVADAVQTAGGVAYDSLAAATRKPGAPLDYTAARDVALAEGQAALVKALPAIDDGAAAVRVAGALGNALASDPAFSAAHPSVLAEAVGVERALEAAPVAPAPGGRSTLVPVMLAAAFAGSALLSACTSSQVGQAVADGQLVCRVGPTLMAVVSPAGSAVLARGATAEAVAGVCSVLGGVPAPPPSTGVAPAAVVPVG